jgi:YVTN family beta-propeller protein
MSSDGSKLYVANYDDNTVSVINSGTNVVLATIPVGTYPQGISVSPDGSNVYVANESDSTVSVINTTTNTVSKTIRVGFRPCAFGNFISTHPVGITPQYILTANINVYPIPAIDNLTIESPQDAVIEITNIQGQPILQQQLQQGKTDINISGLAKGVYILRLCSNDKTEVSRIIKE